MAALAAVYVIVLQALLLPLSVAAGNPLAGALCLSASGETPSPAHQDSTCPCAAGCGMQCGTNLLAPPQAHALAPRLTRGHAMTAAASPTPAARHPAKGPQNPRAPPAA